jgi:hypothetical protein
MQLVEFLIGDENFPVYRTVADREVEILKALLGRDFHFELVDGEPMDELLFDVLTPIAVEADFFFVPPPEATVVGTFELKDVEVPTPEPRRVRGRRMRPGPLVQ